DGLAEGGHRRQRAVHHVGVVGLGESVLVVVRLLLHRPPRAVPVAEMVMMVVMMVLPATAEEVAKQILHVAAQPHAVLERADDVPGGQVADQTAGVREEMTEVPPETAAAPVHVLL